MPKNPPLDQAPVGWNATGTASGLLLTSCTGEMTLVDEANYEQLSRYRWNCQNGHGQEPYFYRKAWNPKLGRSQKLYLHRAILGLTFGSTGRVDHINMDMRDNREANLRLCTPRQSNCHVGPRTNNRSGYKGVETHATKSGVRYQACIYSGSRHHLGTFDTALEAAAAYNKAALEYFGPYAWLNPIPGFEN